MKERPILFSGPMVRALLEGRKTQTRRIVKPQPPSGYDRCCWFDMPVMGWTNEPEPALNWHKVKCPYGMIGDRLWVKETFMAESQKTIHYRADGWDYSDCPDSGWKPSIFMPRWASRITLEITDVRVERLQDISEEDAIAEGCEATDMTAEDLADIAISDDSPTVKGLAAALGVGTFPAKYDYQMLWESINGAGSWAKNPWAWVVVVEKIHETLAGKVHAE